MDVEYIRRHTDVIFNAQHNLVPSPPSEKKDRKKKESPKKKNATFKKSKTKKGGKGKGKKDPDASSKMLQQKKNMYANYIEACKKLKCVPSQHICNLFSLQESVDWTKEEREQMNQPITDIAMDEQLGPAGTRAFACALVGAWVGGSDKPFGSPYEILRSLTIKNGNLKLTGGDAIAGLLEFSGKLAGTSPIEVLNLYACNISPNGIKSISRALRFGYNNSLLELRLDGDITIGDEGCSHLCDALTTNGRLKVLSLGSCGIGSSGSKAIGELLKSFRCNLDYLSVEANSIGQVGLMYICNGLLKIKVKIAVKREVQFSERCSKLKTLNIASIGLTSDTHDGVEALAHVMLENTNILNIDFNLNDLDEYGGKVLYSALSTAKTSGGSKIRNFVVSPQLPSKLFNALYLNEKISRKFDAMSPLSTHSIISFSTQSKQTKSTTNKTSFDNETVQMPPTFDGETSEVKGKVVEKNALPRIIQ